MIISGNAALGIFCAKLQFLHSPPATILPQWQKMYCSILLNYFFTLICIVFVSINLYPTYTLFHLLPPDSPYNHHTVVFLTGLYKEAIPTSVLHLKECYLIILLICATGSNLQKNISPMEHSVIK